VAVKAVYFDVGETLLDETRHWTAIAEEVGVPPLTFFAVGGALIAGGESDHGKFFDAFGVDRVAGPPLERRDLYPDALPCLGVLKRRGLAIGIVGNQPARTEEMLAACGVEVDFVGSSETWGVAKPAPEFFGRVVDQSGVAAEEVAYVGDRVDNDVEPALRAGLVAVHVKRGPWGWLQTPPPEAIRVANLAELPEALGV
jgi:FMN phosphatase YigB (HAD superfamily)